MPWNDNGVTVERKLLDQQAVVSSWGASPVRVPTRQLRTAGYLHELQLWSPLTTYTGAGVVGTGTIASQPIGQIGVLRAIQRFQLTLQAIAQIYDVTGEDLAFLLYTRPGYYNFNVGQVPLNASAGSNNVNAINQYGQAASILGAANGTVPANPQYGLWVPIPITEWIIFRDSVVAQSQGQTVLADKPMEIGLVTLQNNQQNVTPSIQLNPAYGLDNNSPFLTTGNATINLPSVPFNISAELYDVPDNPADRPNPFTQSFVVTRQAFDVPLVNGAATYTFKPAGMLLRAIYALYQDGAAPNNGVLLDPSATASIASFNTGSIKFKWGSTVSKLEESFQENFARSTRRYNAPPPGILVHDFMDDGTLTDAINTSRLTNIRAEITGANTSATRLHVVEERLIPVRVAQ